ESRYDALRGSEKKYRDIVDLSPIGICRDRPDGTIFMANAALARMLGCASVEETLTLNSNDVFSDAADRSRLIAQYSAAGYGERLEVRLRRRDGTPFWGEIT